MSPTSWQAGRIQQRAGELGARPAGRIDLVLAANAVAADILINWRRVVVEFISRLEYEIPPLRSE